MAIQDHHRIPRVGFLARRLSAALDSERGLLQNEGVVVHFDR